MPSRGSIRLQGVSGGQFVGPPRKHQAAPRSVSTPSVVADRSWPGLTDFDILVRAVLHARRSAQTRCSPRPCIRASGAALTKPVVMPVVWKKNCNGARGASSTRRWATVGADVTAVAFPPRQLERPCGGHGVGGAAKRISRFPLRAKWSVTPPIQMRWAETRQDRAVAVLGPRAPAAAVTARPPREHDGPNTLCGRRRSR